MREYIASVLSAGAVLMPVAAQAAPETSDESQPLARHAAPLDPVETAMLRHEVARRLARAERSDSREKRRKRARRVAVSPALQAIAACESGGNPRAIGGGGAYRGKYQMSPSTWASVGGKGDPAAASEAEQDRRAAILYATAGPGQWPVCSQ